MMFYDQESTDFKILADPFYEFLDNDFWQIMQQSTMINIQYYVYHFYL